MIKKFIFMFLFYLLAWSALTLSPLSVSMAESFSSIEIPIYPGGFNVTKSIKPSERMKSIFYHVRTEYPAAEVLEFYDAYFNAKGWISSFEICQRHWDDSSETSRENELPERRMFASWQNPNADLKAVLWLKYKSVNQAGQKEVVVHCQLLPNVNH